MVGVDNSGNILVEIHLYSGITLMVESPTTSCMKACRDGMQLSKSLLFHANYSSLVIMQFNTQGVQIKHVTFGSVLQCVVCHFTC